MVTDMRYNSPNSYIIRAIKTLYVELN